MNSNQDHPYGAKQAGVLPPPRFLQPDRGEVATPRSVPVVRDQANTIQCQLAELNDLLGSLENFCCRLRQPDSALSAPPLGDPRPAPIHSAEPPVSDILARSISDLNDHISYLRKMVTHLSESV